MIKGLEVLVCCAIVSVILSIQAPWVLGDSNVFLKEFVGPWLINFLAVVVTITLSSAASLHLELNKLEEGTEGNLFPKTRKSVKRSAYSLIATLLLAVFLLITKPLAIGACNSEMVSSLFNSAAILMVVFDISILFDLIGAAFKIQPNMKNS